MNSKSLITLAMSTLSCNQSKLADLLGVSKAQISKWKSGETISRDMEVKILDLIGLDKEASPELIQLTGSKEQADKWCHLISYLTKHTLNTVAPDIHPAPLDMGLGVAQFTFEVLSNLNAAGVQIPHTFPKELDLVGITTETESIIEDESVFDDIKHAIDNNELASTIIAAFECLCDVYEFYEVNIQETVYALEKLTDYQLPTEIEDIEDYLFEVALAKTDIDSLKYPSFDLYKTRVLHQLSMNLWVLKKTAYNHRVPLQVEVMHLVHTPLYELGQLAEMSITNVFSGAIHPDTYMNELLVGMRKLQTALPVICEKLGIPESDLMTDTKSLIAIN